MCTQHTRIVLAVIVLTAALGMAYCTLAVAGSKKGSPIPEFLGEEHLQGSMQGRSGIALDVNGDGIEDLVIGAPYAHHKGASGALLFYLATSRGFPKHASVVLQGEGNLGWSLTSLGNLDGDGNVYFAAGGSSGSGQNTSLSGTVTVYKGGERFHKVALL